MEQPSALEKFWASITCHPIIDPTEDSLVFQQENSRRYVSPHVRPEERKRQNDMDVIEQRLREAAVKRRQERKGAAEEDVLGANLIAERERVMQEEAFRRDKAREFEEQRYAALTAQKEDAQKQGASMGFFEQVGSIDMTFGLGSAISKAMAAPVGFEADSLTQSVTTLPQEDRDRFDQLLGLEGLGANVFLPSRDGGSKLRKAVFRCDRNSTFIVCEITGKKDRTKTIRFDVKIVGAIRLGAGKSVSVPTDMYHGDSRRFHFVLADKPDLTCELESTEARDAALAGFVYLVSTRRSPLYTQQINTNKPISMGKGGQWATLPSLARGANARCLTGWNRWYDVVEKGMLRTKYKPRLLLLTDKYELEVYAPPNDSKATFPADMVVEGGPLKRYLDGNWSSDVLEDEGFTYCENMCCTLSELQSVTAQPGKGGDFWIAVAFDDADKPTVTFRVSSLGEQRYVVDFLMREMKKAESLLRGGR